ncbi:MAG: collagen-like protein [Bryobacteraceae bacterium]|jgi:hypothetical protein
MKRVLISVVVVFLSLVLAPVVAQNTMNYVLPLWSGRWNYFTLGPSFHVSGSVIDVPITQGAAGPAGPQGAPGPAGPQGAPGVPFLTAANQVIAVSAPQSVFHLTCAIADIYRNGLLQSEGGADYSLDPSGLVATFAPAAQAGDAVKIIYRCQ